MVHPTEVKQLDRRITEEVLHWRMKLYQLEYNLDLKNIILLSYFFFQILVFKSWHLLIVTVTLYAKILVCYKSQSTKSVISTLKWPLNLYKLQVF